MRDCDPRCDDGQLIHVCDPVGLEYLGLIADSQGGAPLATPSPSHTSYVEPEDPRTCSTTATCGFLECEDDDETACLEGKCKCHKVTCSNLDECDFISAGNSRMS